MDDEWQVVAPKPRKKPVKRNEQTSDSISQLGRTVPMEKKMPDVPLVKKLVTGSNKQHQTQISASVVERKADSEDASLHTKQVDHDLAKRIMQARNNKGWTQRDLAIKISEKPEVVRDYEAAKAIPNEQIIVKMERAFNIRLRGKLAGQPLQKFK